MWLPKENKYSHKSQRARREDNAIEKGEGMYLEICANLLPGNSNFSIITKEGVETTCRSISVKLC